MCSWFFKQFHPLIVLSVGAVNDTTSTESKMNMKGLLWGEEGKGKEKKGKKRGEIKTILFFGVFKKMLLSVIVVPGVLSKKPSLSE